MSAVQQQKSQGRRSRDVFAITRRRRWQKAIEFHALAAADLGPERRAVLVKDWNHRTEQEYLAVRVFAMLTAELAAEGASDTVLSLVARAVSDEIAHADLCRQLADAFAGERRRVRPPPPRNVPPHPAATPRERTYLHMVEMCCIGETLTTCFFTEALQRTKAAPMRTALKLLLEDELDHGRAGWAYLASADENTRGRVAKALPSMLDRTVGWLPTAVKSGRRGDPFLEGYGHLAPPTVIDVYRTGLRDVVLAGLHAAGVDIAPALEHAVRVGMLARS